MSLMQRLLLGDRYTLVELLGSGGMAEVYLARDNSLDRHVAIKVLRERYADDEEFVERFRREALNAAALNHPGIVQVYDRGRTEDGDFYITMEYVPGGTLKERIKAEGSLAPREAADMALRVADALAVAHDRGIVHRDVKPQNVLLTASGEAKVSDFGIARATSSETMTQTNAVLGTLAYMSPEQVRGERVGPASDLYSLGVLLYEMLTGELPYRGDDPIATAMKRLDEEPPHPRETNPAVPEELDALVARLLAKDPGDRYASAASLSRDLRRLLDGLPPLADEAGDATTARATRQAEHVHTSPALPAGRGSGPPAGRRRPRTVVVPLVVLLVVVVLIGGLAWALGRTSPDRTAQDEAAARKVEVPLLVGLPPDQAQKRLEKAGLELGSRDEVPSATIAEGAVSEQDPAAGTRAERGRAVNVVLSADQPQEPAPQVSPSATPTATTSATASPDAASPGAKKAAEEAAKEARERREEARKQVQERREEAREKAQERRKEQAKEGAE
jgi:tRNA A-37 threonylcarbamoyl transferase component Bud32